MDVCDVLIVGGGPAGASVGRELQRSGLDVLLIDKADFPRDKVCAGWITPAVVETLELDLEAYAGCGAATRSLQALTGFRTGLIGGESIEHRYPRVVSYAIRRCEFDEYLLRRAKLRLRLGQAVTSIVRRDRHWLVNGEIMARMLVGAGGHFCPVARHLGGRHPSSETLVFAREAEFPIDPRHADACRIEAGTAELYFSRDMKGYGWCLRKGEYLNVGLGRHDGHRLPQHMEEFTRFLEDKGRLRLDPALRFHGHAYLLHGHGTRPLFDEGVLLVGDAAGLAGARSGEGIGPAVCSAALAARVILAAAGDYRRDALAAYGEGITRILGAGVANSPTLFKPLRRLLGHALLKTAWLSRELVLDRWFLHAGSPLSVIRPVIG